MKPDNAANSDEAALPALAWLRRARAEDELLQAIALKVRRQRTRRIAAGATCLGALVVLFAVLREPALPRATPPLAPPVATTATLLRPALQTLPDGSVVELKDGARIAVEFTPALRRITLVSGEAHFQVAKNPNRPFVVGAGQVEVRAVGTAFSVALAPALVDVLVTEGTVSVAAENRATPTGTPSPRPSVALVNAGDRCVVDASLVPQVQGLSAGDADEKLAWRIPQLEFSRAPLPDVVDAMNRHAATKSAVRLEVGDPTLNQLTLTGFLRADNTEGLLRLLETNFNVSADRSGTTIVLRRSP